MDGEPFPDRKWRFKRLFPFHCMLSLDTLSFCYGGGIEVASPQRKRISFWDCWQGTFRHLQSFYYSMNLRQGKTKLEWLYYQVAAQRGSQGTIAKGKMDVKSDGKVKESKKILGIDLGAAKDNTLTTVSAKIFNYNSVDLEQRNHEASYCNMHLLNSVSSHRIQNVLIDIPHGKVNHKKAQKLRFVEDIMKIEEPHTSKKKLPSNGSECEARLGDFSEYNQNKEEELSLMNWLKKTSKKIVTDDFRRKKTFAAKENVEIKDMNKKVAIYDNVLSDKDVNHILQGSKVNKCNKEYTLVKENEVSSVKSSGEKVRRKKLYGIEDRSFFPAKLPSK